MLKSMARKTLGSDGSWESRSCVVEEEVSSSPDSTPLFSSPPVPAPPEPPAHPEALSAHLAACCRKRSSSTDSESAVSAGVGGGCALPGLLAWRRRGKEGGRGQEGWLADSRRCGLT